MIRFIILNVKIVANGKCGFFKMSNASHLTMLLPNLLEFCVMHG
jgi:hypothetical protein